MGASVNVDQIRTELLIQEYGMVVRAEFLPLANLPRFNKKSINTSDIKSAILYIQTPSDSSISRYNFMFWRISNGKSISFRPIFAKDPVFEFWHFKKCMESKLDPPAMESLELTVTTLKSNVEKLRDDVDELIQSKFIKKHNEAMREVVRQLSNCLFECRRYYEETGLSRVYLGPPMESRCIEFAYCPCCGEHYNENQAGCNLAYCDNCNRFNPMSSYSGGYDSEDSDEYYYEDGETETEFRRKCAEDSFEDVRDRYEDW